jgi:hypothetical protein
MRLTLYRAVLMGLLAAPAEGLALDLPVVHPGREAVTGASYRGDLIEIQLGREASRLAAIAVESTRLGGGPRAPRPVRLRALGVSSVDALAAALGGTELEPEFRGERPPASESEPDLAAFFLVRLPAGTDLESALARFRALPDVVSADPIAVLPVAVVPNDSLWAASYWLFQPSRRDIHAPEAWDVSQGDTTVVIAILDTGVLPYHPDLGGQVAGRSGQMWVNAAERNGIAGLDDDGNGWIDDVSGWDFVDRPNGAGIPAAEDWDAEDNDPNDYAGHGTFVAGFAGAAPDNGIGLTGAAWNVRLMPVRMAWATDVNPLGLVDMSYAAQAIHYAWRSGAHVINASWASLIQSGLDVMARQALRGGVTIVAAAGNNNQPHELAEFDDVIAVAATDALDQLAGFSNRGPWVDLSAPGANMAGTFVSHADVDSLGSRTPAYMDGLGGTSFAAPLVSGAAALVIAERRASGLPPLTPTSMRMRVRETADDISAENPGGGFGSGRLRLDRALTDPPTSQAVAMGAAMVGAPVVVPAGAGRTRIVSAHQNARLVMLDGQDGDTVWVATLPGAPIADVAAADLGGGRGPGFFVGTSNRRIAGFDVYGAPLPGWPVIVTGFSAQPVPVLGDLDGDGAPEIIATTDAQLLAFRADGTPMPGFPLDLLPNTRPVALANLDGAPGLEIAVVTDSLLYVVGGDGIVPSGWPILFPAFPTQPPAIARIRPFSLPTILATAGSELHAFAPNGSTRWLPKPMGGTATAPMALGDLDADGSTDVIVPLNPAALAVFDSLGEPLTALNWPRVLPSAAGGHPVAGPLDGGAHASVLIFRTGGLYAFNDSARALPSYPRLGGAGPAPSLADLDGDGRTEILAGTDSRSLFYIHDAGPGTWNAMSGNWLTARGNYARTGSTVDAPAPPVYVDAPPAEIADLEVAPASDTSVTLRWTAVGEDGATGRPQSYELAVASQPLTEQNFDAAPIRRSVVATVNAGGEETALVAPLAADAVYWVAARAVDRAGQRGAVSNTASVTLGNGGGPLAGRVGTAIVPLARPSRLPVEFHWQGPGGPPNGPQKIELFDLSGRRIRTIPLGAGLSGVTSWDGRTAQGDVVRAGMYFARLASGSFHAEARVVLLP